MHWHLLVTPPAPGAENMAVDEALMDRARTSGEAVLRVYGWSAPTLSLGRNQIAKGRYDLARAAAEGIGIVRRPTGGRALLHHREITYSVTAPVQFGTTLQEAYDRINQLLADALQRLGVAAELARPTGRPPIPGDAPCFELPTAGELVVGDRKLVGSAQFRDKDALLQHGSILIDDDQHLVAQLSLAGVDAPPPPATLRGVLGRVPAVDEVADALFAALVAREDPRPGRMVFDEALLANAMRARERYLDDAWTWRR